MKIEVTPRQTVLHVGLAAVLVLAGVPAVAFPPYRSTDADTAPAGTVEARLGLFRVQRERSEDEYTSPLLRLNLGIAGSAELTSELEYNVEEGRVGDGALGVKLVARAAPWSVGVETLALLPVAHGQSGLGVESQLVATLLRAPYRLHVNAGGSYDGRSIAIQRAWRASVLAEREHGGARIGLEFFARQLRGEHTELQAGAGVIFPMGPLAVRAALHAGLTSRAPDVTASLWLSKDMKIW